MKGRGGRSHGDGFTTKNREHYDETRDVRNYRERERFPKTVRPRPKTVGGTP